MLLLDPVGPGLDRAGSGRGGRWGLKQGAWRSFLARQPKNPKKHFHRPPASLSRPSVTETRESTSHWFVPLLSYLCLPKHQNTSDLGFSCRQNCAETLYLVWKYLRHGEMKNKKMNFCTSDFRFNGFFIFRWSYFLTVQVKTNAS
jgi:hypothetical protein